MADDNEPTPIPESITYDGTNAEAVRDWARQTLEHYEQSSQSIGYWEDLQNPEIGITNHANGNSARAIAGQDVTFSEKQGFYTRHDAGPEILAQDHPRTVAETKLIQDAQRKLGVEPQARHGQEFVHRRALAESMQRHPSNALVRANTPAAQYAQPVQLNASKATVHHITRVRPV